MSALPLDPDVAAQRVPAPPPLPLHPRPVRRPATATDTSEPAPTAEATPSPPTTAAVELADPDRWFGAIALAVVEVLAGGRAAQQLVRWVTPEIYGAVARRAGLRVRLHGRPARPAHGRVLSARATITESGAVEVCAVIHDGRRVRAVAGRLELFRDRWRVIELQVG
ncbi:Rv3235 family protein [Serinibacter arcticus]|uniref:Uncharacterized protein n=1 Tax=Serinibacter arcticus TaxID=1655435 RepID=A0A4Z1E092_9MICO|nr:Rv3235 family protein [Serinibacter arcticus]TGO04052.1 hypothetical protein SERN_2643 [Serinibacter arcticus]